MPDFHIEVAHNPAGARILRVAGPLTLSTLFDFQAEIRAEESKPLLIDLGGVPYMDSAGLGAVLGGFASCQRTSRGFAIANAADRIKMLFKVAHVDKLLPYFDTVEAAEASLT